MANVNATCRKCAGQLLKCDKCGWVYCWACDGTGRSCPKCGTNNRADSTRRGAVRPILLLAALLLGPASARAAEKDYVAVVIKQDVWIISVKTDFDSTQRMAKMMGMATDDVIASTNAYHCEVALKEFPGYDSFAMGSTAPGNRVIYFTSSKGSCKKLLKEPADERDRAMAATRIIKKLDEVPEKVQAAIRKKLAQ